MSHRVISIAGSLFSFSTCRKIWIVARNPGRVSFQRFGRVFLGGGFELSPSGLQDGRLVFEGAFTCRRHVSVTVRSGCVTIGAGTFLNRGVSLNCLQAITIGSGVMFGEGVKVYDHDHAVSKDGEVLPSEFVIEEVAIGDGVWIGSNAIILRGSRIGTGSIIGAGTIVKGEIPPGSKVYDRRDQVVKPLV
jgi:acetyltransferase-like isoleucine patch superfamily enzyme